MTSKTNALFFNGASGRMASSSSGCMGGCLIMLAILLAPFIGLAILLAVS